MRNHWTDKSAIRKYIDLLTREIANLCGADYDMVRILLEAEVLKRPFTPEEIEQLIMADEEDILSEARRIHAYLTNDSSDGLW